MSGHAKDSLGITVTKHPAVEAVRAVSATFVVSAANMACGTDQCLALPVTGVNAQGEPQPHTLPMGGVTPSPKQWLPRVMSAILWKLKEADRPVDGVKNGKEQWEDNKKYVIYS